jgi:hypothetical protein
MVNCHKQLHSQRLDFPKPAFPEAYRCLWVAAPKEIEEDLPRVTKTMLGAGSNRRSGLIEQSFQSLLTCKLG